MKSNIESNTERMLQNVYLSNSSIYYKIFSQAQELKAVDYLKESIRVLKRLCGSISLQVHHILITCCDIMEMSRSIPSAEVKAEVINMQSFNCLSIARLAAMIKQFNNDPVSVTPTMIRKDCNQIVLIIR